MQGEFVYVGNKETEQKFRETFLKLCIDDFWKQVEKEVKNIWQNFVKNTLV